MNFLLKLLCLSWLLTLSLPVIGQEVELNFGSKMKLSPKKQGQVSKFIGVTQNHVYSINCAVGTVAKRKYDAIVAYDKSSLKEVSRLSLYGHGTSRIAGLKNAMYEGTFFGNNEIMVIYTLPNGKNSFEIKAEIFDEKLQSIKKFTRLFSSADLLKKYPYGDIIGLKIKQNEETKDLALILEIANGEGKNLSFFCLKFDFGLNQFYSASTDIPIPQETKRKPTSLLGSYYYPNDGFIYAKHRVLEDNEATKSFWKTGKYKIVLTRFDPIEERIDLFDIVDKKYSLTDISLISNNQETKIVGFYRDPSQASFQNTSHGVFTLQFNKLTRDIEGIDFSAFTTQQMDQIFHRVEISERAKKKLERRASKKEDRNVTSDGKQEGVYADLIIDDLHIDVEGSVLIICSLMRNYSVTTCTSNPNGGTSCYTNYYCERIDINTIQLSPEGRINYASSIDRRITYNGTSIYDVSSSIKNDQLFVYFGNANSSRSDRAEKKRKYRQKGQTEWIYAQLDMRTGQLEKKSVDIQQISKRKKDQRNFDPELVGVFGDEVYSYNLVAVMNPVKAVPFFASSVFVLPVYFFMFNQNILYDFYGTIVKVEIR